MYSFSTFYSFEVFGFQMFECQGLNVRILEKQTKYWLFMLIYQHFSPHGQGEGATR